MEDNNNMTLPLEEADNNITESPVSSVEYTDDNIGSLLLARHTARKIRRGGGRLHGPKKRDAQQDAAFEAALIRVLDELTRG